VKQEMIKKGKEAVQLYRKAIPVVKRRNSI